MRRFKNFNIDAPLAFTLISIIIIVYIASLLQDIIVPFIFAGIISFLLKPMNNWMERRGIPRILAIIISIIFVLVVLAVVVYAAYSQIIKLDSLFPQIEVKLNYWTKVTVDFLNENFHINKEVIILEAQKYISDGVKMVSKFLGATVGGTSGFIISIALLPLYIFLMLLYRDFLTVFIFKWFKHGSKHKIMRTISKIEEVVKGYVLGLFLVIIIIGSLNSIALSIIGIQNAVFFGFFASVLVILPYIGITIGAALPIFVALVTKDSYMSALAVAASFAVIQFLEGNFITPVVVGNKVSINSLVAITALLLFGKLWGIGGMILALPVTAILKVLFEASEKTEAWAFLLGDAENAEVVKVKREFNLSDFFSKFKKNF